jgi:hypothetical protein
MSRPEFVLFAMLASLRLVVDASGQERETPEKKPLPPVPHRFFDRPIDYWQRGLGYEEPKETEPKSEKREGRNTARTPAPSDWGQMVKQPDGTLAFHDLPRPLIEVLEDPSPDKVRAYFEWKLTRTQKILRAAEAMKQFRGSLPEYRETNSDPAPGGDPGPPERALAIKAPELKVGQPADLSKGAPAPPFTVTYFHKGGCPHCDTEDVILAAWLKNKPEAKLEVIDFGVKPELWRQYRVRGTPSLVIEDGITRKTVFLEGLSKEPALDQALAECRAVQPPKASSKEGIER